MADTPEPVKLSHVGEWAREVPVSREFLETLESYLMAEERFMWQALPIPTLVFVTPLGKRLIFVETQ